jgi:predicted nucleic acid-binding protein
MPAEPGISHGANSDPPPPPFGGSVLIADNSAWQRADRLPAHIKPAWLAALIGHQIATSAIVNLEVLYSARSAAEFDELEEELDALRDVPITRSVCRTALWAIREINHSRRPCRISPPDALIAAAAHHAEGVSGVLHYDHHYDRLADVLAVESVWIAPAGSIP